MERGRSGTQPSVMLLPVTLMACAGSGQRARRRAGHNRTVLDAELAAMARAADRAVGDLIDGAPRVGADRAERLELARRGLGDDDLLTGEDLSAVHRDLARGGERGRALTRTTAARRGGARCTSLADTRSPPRWSERPPCKRLVTTLVLQKSCEY
jgi:hypothetical protein